MLPLVGLLLVIYLVSLSDMKIEYEEYEGSATSKKAAKIRLPKIIFVTSCIPIIALLFFSYRGDIIDIPWLFWKLGLSYGIDERPILLSLIGLPFFLTGFAKDPNKSTPSGLYSKARRNKNILIMIGIICFFLALFNLFS